MSLKKHSHEEIKTMSMIELSNLVLSDKKKTISFKELFDEIASLKEFTDEQKGTYIAQFYTDINIDGRFVNTGSNTWGLKLWYPVDKVTTKETKPAAKKKPKKRPVKKKPEGQEETEDNETSEDDLEELTADFSKLDGKDDVDEDMEDLDIFAEELDDVDEDYDDEDFDDYDEDEEEEDTK